MLRLLGVVVAVPAVGLGRRHDKRYNTVRIDTLVAHGLSDVVAPNRLESHHRHRWHPMVLAVSRSEDCASHIAHDAIRIRASKLPSAANRLNDSPVAKHRLGYEVASAP